MQVLIADDSPTTRFALTRNLISWGYDPIVADDGDDAWRLLSCGQPPRIAILDWMMPGINGVEICRRLADRTDGPMIYTILLTSRNSEADLVYALENGGHNFQSKPYSPQQMRAHLAVGKRLVESDDKIKEYAQQMEQLASTDQLTGLCNRRYFYQAGALELNRSHRYEHPLSAMMIDLDHFKQINDTLGHEAGDHTLAAVADILGHTLRQSDLLGRIGGEEFAVLLTETPLAHAEESAGRLMAAIRQQTIATPAGPVTVTLSIGLTEATDQDDLDSLLRRADQALYRAKESGRDRVVVQPATDR